MWQGKIFPQLPSRKANLIKIFHKTIKLLKYFSRKNSVDQWHLSYNSPAIKLEKRKKNIAEAQECIWFPEHPGYVSKVSLHEPSRPGSPTSPVQITCSVHLKKASIPFPVFKKVVLLHSISELPNFRSAKVFTEFSSLLLLLHFIYCLGLSPKYPPLHLDSFYLFFTPTQILLLAKSLILKQSLNWAIPYYVYLRIFYNGILR